jgi:hypothetical protein
MYQNLLNEREERSFAPCCSLARIEVYFLCTLIGRLAFVFQLAETPAGRGVSAHLKKLVPQKAGF